MPSGHPITDDDKKRIKSLFVIDQLMPSVIAKEYNIKPATVRKILSE